VPKGWDRNERLVWSLTAHGRTDVAKAWLQPEWEIENGSKTRDGEANAAPRNHGSGPQRVTWPAEPVQLTAAASDDGLPKPTRRPPTSQPAVSASANAAGVAHPGGARRAASSN